jgi:hypothetical protein
MIQHHNHSADDATGHAGHAHGHGHGHHHHHHHDHAPAHAVADEARWSLLRASLGQRLLIAAALTALAWMLIGTALT